MLDDTYERIDPRTMMLRCGLVVESAKASEMLETMSEDILRIMEESEYADGYEEPFSFSVELSLIASLCEDSPLAGLPQMAQVADGAMTKAVTFLNDWTPRWTYYGIHRDDASCLGVWLDWPRIDAAIDNGDIIRPSGVWTYVRIQNGEDRPPTVFNWFGEQHDPNDPDVEDKAADGLVYEVDVTIDRDILIDMEDDNLVCVDTRNSSLVFVA